MFRSFRLGTLLGFPIEVNVSFLLLLGLAALTMGGLGAIFVVLLAFASVLAHELGHAVVARRLGVRVASIELHFFGGAAKIVDQPRRPGDEIAIAAAGPAVSFALGGLALLAARAIGAPVLSTLAWFNLLPALPMDGGRILRALLCRRLGFVRATEISVMLARGFAVLLGVVAVATGQLYLAALAVLLWFMAGAELHTARYHARFGGAAGGDGRVEVLPRRARWPGRGAEPPRSSPLRPFWSNGFVVRREGDRVVIEPID